jgi:hypothetical protein
MFSCLCFFKESSWHGISYAGGGLNTQHGDVCESAAHNADYSKKEIVYPATTQELGLRPPTNYMIGNFNFECHVCLRLQCVRDAVRYLSQLSFRTIISFFLMIPV